MGADSQLSNIQDGQSGASDEDGEEDVAEEEEERGRGRKRGRTRGAGEPGHPV